VPNSFWQQHKMLSNLIEIFALTFLPITIFVLPVIIPCYLIWGILQLSKAKKPKDIGR
jgi:hypothetical protein